MRRLFRGRYWADNSSGMYVAECMIYTVYILWIKAAEPGPVFLFYGEYPVLWAVKPLCGVLESRLPQKFWSGRSSCSPGVLVARCSSTIISDVSKQLWSLFESYNTREVTRDKLIGHIIWYAPHLLCFSVFFCACRVCPKHKALGLIFRSFWN